MTHQVAQLLKELREDHQNMALLVELLERESSRIHDGNQPDFELLHDIMNYMTVYADVVHHPKEDLIYDKLHSERKDLAEDLERVTIDHRVIADLSQTLRRDIEAIMAGVAVTRDRVIADTFAYVEQLRHHMGWEEEHLFKRADELVKDSASVSVNASHLSETDPVFGPTRDRAFDNLLHSIQNEAAQQ